MTAPGSRIGTAIALAIAALCVPAFVAMADGRVERIEELPAYDRYQAARRELGGPLRSGQISRVHWFEDESGVVFRRDDTWYRVDFADRRVIEHPDGPPEAADGGDGNRPRRGRGPGRGRQSRSVPSPDGRWTAECRDYNLWLVDKDSADERQVTTDGTSKLRYATANWVYGEELRQNSAMWWSPDSKRVAFYHFDERPVRDYYLLAGQTEIHDSVLTEGYPKPGDPNPIASLLLHDVETNTTYPVQSDWDEQEYLFNVRFSPGSAALLFHRTNRHQDVLELVAADPETGECRVVVRETQPAWQENNPRSRFLADGHRFIWETERTGWKHFELRNLDGERLATLTSGSYPTESIVRVDEEAGLLYFTAFNGASPLNQHLNRVGLDGSNPVRLTPDGFYHDGFRLSPDGAWFIATSERVDVPRRTGLYDRNGELITWLAIGRDEAAEKLGFPPVEVFEYTAADGVTPLYGLLYRPSDFDPSREYPLVVDVYGGPLSRAIRNRYARPRATCELGYLVARLDNRGTRGRGKAYEAATYLQLGTVDLADQVAGVRALAERPEVDGERVGIYGSSYGGYMAALGVLRHPDVFRAAIAISAVTDWRNYDTIYTERFMRTPEENQQGYDTGSCMTYADKLEGGLLLLHGMLDDNVHPSNAWQLVDALHTHRRPFEMMFFPNRGHGVGGPVSRSLMWTFFARHLQAEAVAGPSDG